MSERTLVWQRLDLPGTEVLRLGVTSAEVMAASTVVSIAGGAPFELRYQVTCDGGWRLRRTQLTLTQGGQERTLHLQADGAGAWTYGDGRALPELAGCIDLDIGWSPFTNTLPIRRLQLEVGERAELAVAFVAVPRLEVTLACQTYTHLADSGDDAYYLYESASGFHAVLRVDREGIVLEYPGFFTRFDLKG
jgi:hypothetical protein